MPAILEALAVQSYCFRGLKTNEEVIQQVKKIGLSRIELCGVHADFNNVDAFQGVLDLYKAAGVQIVSIGVQGFSGHEGNEVKWFEFAKRAGCTMISAHFDLRTTPYCYRVAERLGDKYDINVAIHNHGGYQWHGSEEMLAYIFNSTSPRIGLNLDCAWMMHTGADPVKVAQRFADRLYGVHIKDFIFDRARKHSDVVVGTGNLDLPALLKVIAPLAHCKNPIIEYEGDVNNPTPALAECVAAVKKAAAA